MHAENGAHPALQYIGALRIEILGVTKKRESAREYHVVAPSHMGMRVLVASWHEELPEGARRYLHERCIDAA